MADAEPRHASRRVAELLAEEIDTGRLPAGAKLPPYRKLASDHGIAVNTAQAAVRLLEDSGRVVIRPSSGVFVAEDPSPAVLASTDRAELSALREQVRGASKTLADVDRALSDLINRPVRSVVDNDR